MRLKAFAIVLVFVSLELSAFSSDVVEGDVLSLDLYLTQVERCHEGIAAACETASAAQERAEEGKLLFRPSVTSQAIYFDTFLPSFAETGKEVRVRENTYQLGVNQQLRSGPQVSLFTGGDWLISTSGGNSVYGAKVTEPLWRNWMARETKAQERRLKHSALATKFSKLFEAQSIYAQAVLAYWQLAICREVHRLDLEALQRATTLRDWHSQRREVNLSNESDLLQSEAAVKRYELEVQVSMDAERQASSTLNSLRGLCSDVVAEEVLLPTDEEIDWLRPPDRLEVRHDVCSAEHAVAATQAAAEEAAQRTYPQVDFFCSGAYKHIDDSTLLLSSGFCQKTADFAAGIQLTIPLDFGLESRVRDARCREAKAAEMACSRRSFEVEREWDDLVRRLEEQKCQIKLHRSIEAAQKKKYEVEKERYRLGKSTTYTLITFEQDYVIAQLATQRRLLLLFEVYARLQLFGRCE